MTLTARDKVLVLFLPAILIGAGYGFWFNARKLDEFAKLQRALADAQTAMPTPTQVLERKARLQQVVPEVRDLEAKNGRERDRWQALVGRCADTTGRNERLEQLTRLLADFDLDLLEGGPADVGKPNHEVKAPASLDALAKQIGESPNGHKPQSWRLRLSGNYLDLARALDRLAGGDLMVIPIGLTMKEARSRDGRREWVLLMWI